MSIEAPVLTVLPALCYWVESFEVLNTLTNLQEPFLSASQTSVDINTTDRSKIGQYSMSITAVLNNGDRLATHTFSI